MPTPPRPLLPLLIACAALAGGGCSPGPPALDLLRAEAQLTEAVVAGRDRSWVVGQIGKPSRLDDVLLRTLPAAPPSRLVFRVDVPRDGRLAFSYGVASEFQNRPPVEFRIRVDAGDGDERSVWSRLLNPLSRPEDRVWRSASVDLVEYAGRSVSLILETSGYDENPDEARRAQWGAPVLAATDPRAPLAIVYLVDTLRADHTSVYGYARDTTPKLAAFARDGVVFDAAVSHASWTKPSVASLFTSRLPGQHLAVQLRDPLDPGLVTLAEMLATRGVATGAAIANSVIYAEGNQFEQGFDGFYGLHDAGGHISKSVDAAVVVDAGLEWLRAHEGLPRFLYLHTMDPHVPYVPPPPWNERYEPHPAPGHPGVDPRFDVHEPLDRDRLIAQYDGEVAYGDSEFGRFVAALKAMGLYERALILFLADHGEEFEDHGHWLHGRTLFDELVRVPMVLKLPGRRAAGRRVGQQVQIVDVLPTVLQHMGLPVPPSPIVVGHPLQAVVEGGAPEPPAVMEISHRGIVAHGLRTRADKYVKHFGPEEAEYYFHLDADPGEQHNLLDENGERVRQMRAAVEAAMVRDPYRRVLRFTGAGRWELTLHTPGWIEGVEPFGLGTGEGYDVENGGRRLVLRVAPRPGRPREFSFSVRPMGAPVSVDGTRDGRRVRPSDVRVARQGATPPAIPFRLPESESENEDGLDVLGAPPPGGDGLDVWLVPVEGRGRLALDGERAQQLCALGYIACK